MKQLLFALICLFAASNAQAGVAWSQIGGLELQSPSNDGMAPDQPLNASPCGSEALLDEPLNEPLDARRDENRAVESDALAPGIPTPEADDSQPDDSQPEGSQPD